MFKYLLKRLVYIVLVFIALSIILFFVYNSVPGDQARAEVFPLRSVLSPERYEEVYQQTRAKMGLDDPLPIRYVKWFKNLVSLDLGMSYRYKEPVIKLLAVPMRNTILMNIFVVFFGLLITIPLGIWMAVRKNSAMDRAIQFTTLIGVSIPVFVVALILIYFFAVQFRLVPVSGMNTAGFRGEGWAKLKDTLHHLILPVSVLVLTSLASTTRFIRSAMVSSLSMDYIKTARAKGVREKVVIYSHAWRNALLPIITLLIGWVVSIFSGSIITESMFNITGMGKFFIDALAVQDWNVALGIQMFYVVLALLSNLIIDISYGFVDPRIRITA